MVPQLYAQLSFAIINTDLFFQNLFPAGVGNAKICRGGMCGYAEMKEYMCYLNCSKDHPCCLEDVHIIITTSPTRVTCFCGGELTLPITDYPDENYCYPFLDAWNIVAGAKSKKHIDFDKLLKVCVNNRPLALARAYLPYKNDTRYHAIGQQLKCHWKCPPCGKCTKTGKHKGDDTTLVSDATELLLQKHWAKGTVVLLSGDGDMLPILKRVSSSTRGFTLEIWCWSGTLNGELLQLANKSCNISVIKLDSYRDSFEKKKKKRKK